MCHKEAPTRGTLETRCFVALVGTEGRMTDDSLPGGAQSHRDARGRSASCWGGGLVLGLVCREERLL